jgi:hypothetical protein
MGGRAGLRGHMTTVWWRWQLRGRCGRRDDWRKPNILGVVAVTGIGWARGYGTYEGFTESVLRKSSVA